ncbi:MAG: diacylglycerol kinase [Betaproteobacteria bacterium RIFCSPLOWO2_12_FULL_65_14]|nr:MAG: diacylglycerol kinase [Betaproteobacteria bacterium RIFCSPLOWO2_12_FULL_65_14]
MENPHKSKPLYARPVFATRIAAEGLAAAWRHEVAFRLEIIACVFLVPFSFFLGKTAVERALLIGSLLLVLIVELVNSALEATLDRISLEEHALVKRAKDVASAAVGLALLNAAAVWGFVLFG